MKKNPMAGAWVVEIVIAILILLLIAKTAGISLTIFSMAGAAASGALIAIGLRLRER